jgi:hypothetical protein
MVEKSFTHARARLSLTDERFELMGAVENEDGHREFKTNR